MTEKAISREDFFASLAPPRQKFFVKELGGHVFIQALSADEREEFEAFSAGKPKSGIQARLLALSVTDEAGNRLFSEADIPAIGKKSAAAVGRIFRAIMKMNALTDDDIKDLEKNL